MATITVVVVQSTAVTALDRIRFREFAAGDGLREITHSEQNTGFLTISGQPASRVNVSIPRTVILHSSAGRHLAFSPDIAVWSTGNSEGDEKNRFPSATGGTASFGSSGLIHFQLGGSLNTNYTAAGSYSGEYVITLTY